MRKCKSCGGHAVAVQAMGVGPVCMGCVDLDGANVEYVCSVAGCGEQPIVIAVLRGGEASVVLVCKSHLKEHQEDFISYVELPSWLTEGSAYLTNEGDLEFRFDLVPEEI